MPELITQFIGGLGLLLIGMSMMTDGLRLASGNALRDILARWTNSRTRGLFSGFLITGVVQSSSAVTVATIGFANAGLLSLEQAIWVIFGSNVGTTMTAWIVALLGFSLDIESFALPLIGLGMLLRLTGSKTRRASLGLALLGLGLLFLGIGFLASAFDTIGADFTLPLAETFTLRWIALYVLTGFILTSLTQSSSAAMVIALSAAQGGLVPLDAAAAVVIGANLGTTTTALLAIIGATPTARRVAVSHLAFNVITALVAVFILGPMLQLTSMVEDGLAIQPGPAVTLAIFHSVFNILGVLLMWPLSPFMTRWLQRCFQDRREPEIRPRYLDRNVLALPFIATDALSLEIIRINHHTISVLHGTLGNAPASKIEHEERVARNLATEAATFTTELNRSELTTFLSTHIGSLLECIQQYLLVLDIADDIAQLQNTLKTELSSSVSENLSHYRAGILQHLTLNDLPINFSSYDGDESYTEVERRYRELKNRILDETAQGRMNMDEMDLLLQFANQAKRACRQILKANRRLVEVRTALQHPADDGRIPADTQTTD